ncbi:MAG: hypothetical protein K1X56_04560 [Flavobacteriales bacterium]|nr:hypothetical protein [Flavobacteriales bacterium]
MKTRTILVFLLVIALGMTACKSHKKNSGDTKSISGMTNDSIPSIKVDPNLEITADHDPFTIDTVTLSGDILSITVSYSGGCKEHQFDLAFNGMYKKSMPVQAAIFLLHENNGDACRALLTKTYRFNIKSIRNPANGPGTVILTLQGWKERITYTY